MDVSTRAKLMQGGIYYIPPWLLSKLCEKQVVDKNDIEHRPTSSSADANYRQSRVDFDRLVCVLNSDNRESIYKTEIPIPFTSLVKDPTTVTNDITETRINEENGDKPCRGRKRKYTDQTRLSRKEKANTNQQYISARGKGVEPKQMKTIVNCRCQCGDKIDIKERKAIFDKYWTAGSYEARCLLIGSMVLEKKPKRPRNSKPGKKMFSRVYTFGNEKKVVCKKFFLESLCISSCTVHTALSKIRSTGPVKDERGHKGGHNKLENERVEAVVKHINNYPKYISHYSQSTDADQLLPPETTLPTMYKTYTQENANPVSFASYKKIFYTKFTRKTLKEGTCTTFDLDENKCHVNMDSESFADNKTKNNTATAEDDKN